MKLSLLTVLGIALLLYQNTLYADDEPKEESKKDAAPVVLSGVFESKNSEELTPLTKQFTSLVIKDIVAHGTKVQKGDKIVSFKTDELDEKLAEAETALELAQLAGEEAEFDFAQFQAAQQLDRAAAARTWKLAKQGHDNYVNVDRQQRIKSAEFSLKSSRESLENALEELHQLEKMYKEDELTEESEEIVLKRAKRSVESAQFRVTNAEIQTTRTIDQKVPAETEEKKAALDRAEMTYDKAKMSLKFARQKREIEFKAAQEKLKKQTDDFQQLREDRKQLVILADRDGIVYHGKLTRGRLAVKPSSLAAGSKVTKDQVLATLIGTKKLQIRVDLAEVMLSKIQVGSMGMATPTSFPDVKLKAKVKSVSNVPMSKGKFDCVLSLDIGKGGSAIVPGMSCSIEFRSAGDGKGQEPNEEEDKGEPKNRDEAKKKDKATQKAKPKAKKKGKATAKDKANDQDKAKKKGKATKKDDE